LIHDLIKPRKFNCAAAEFTEFAAEFANFFPQKTVGPKDEITEI